MTKVDTLPLPTLSVERCACTRQVYVNEAARESWNDKLRTYTTNPILSVLNTVFCNRGAPASNGSCSMGFPARLTSQGTT